MKEGNGNWNIYYICRDYLGSITHITNSSGSVVQELSYDAWGRLRNPVNQTAYTPGSEPVLFLGRGYTGHEHLTQFGLINMNARLYDPAVGRFLSPDPYVQSPLFTQNFNRYSYALNNPLRYTDTSGEIGWTIINAVKDFLVNTFVKSWSQGINAWTNGDNWHSTVMAWKIDIGLIQGTPRQILSRFFWETPQFAIGYGTSQVQNLFNGVKSVSYYGGATAVEYYSKGWGAFTLGSFINGERGLSADPNNCLFQHEYGHYLQSQSWGQAYLSRIGIPSLMGAMKYNDGNHNFQPYEQDANRRAFMYFNENVNGFYQTEAQYQANQAGGIEKGWNFKKNPLDVNHTATRGTYYDYDNSDDRALINSLSINTMWYDYFDPVGIIVGTSNGIYYNQRRVK